MSDHSSLLTPRQQISVLRQWYAMENPSGTAFLVCIDCGAKVEQSFSNLYWMRDEDIAPVFLQQGWTIKPTRCPKCANTKEG